MYTLGIICLLNAGLLFAAGLGGLIMGATEVSPDGHTRSWYSRYSWSLIVTSVAIGLLGFLLCS